MKVNVFASILGSYTDNNITLLGTVAGFKLYFQHNWSSDKTRFRPAIFADYPDPTPLIYMCGDKDPCHFKLEVSEKIFAAICAELLV